MSDTSARWPVDRLLTAAAAALLIRRAAETVQVVACARWARRQGVLPAATPAPVLAPTVRIVCIVPLYNEQDIAAATVRYWHELTLKAIISQVFFVSTVKEEPADGSTTHELVAQTLAELGDPKSLRLLHWDRPHRYRAVQLNTAVDHLRCDAPTADTWVGVYNADSRPDPGTFAELAAKACTDPHTRVYQQLAEYVVPDRGRATLTAAGNAALQTWWTRAHYYARNTAGRRRSWLAAAVPYSTFGHGEFFRLEFLEDIGGFPDFAYADGLLTGWICRLRGEPIGLLASLDRAEVPRTGADLTTQQYAWMRGLLNFGQSVTWARNTGQVAISPGQLTALRLAHQVIPVAWGMSTPVLAGLTAAVVTRSLVRGPRLADTVRLAAILAYPVIPAAVMSATDRSRCGILTRVGGSAVSWPREGLAFWPALIRHLRRDQQAPAKTPR